MKRRLAANQKWRWWWKLGTHVLWRTHANGTLVLHPCVKRVLVDVGVHQRSQFLDHAKESDDVMVIGFEPLVDLVQQHERHQRLLLVPAAVTPEARNGTRVHFHAYTGLQSTLSSLLPLSERLTMGQDYSVGTVDVHAVALSDLFNRLPLNVAVPMLKIDAQGSDLSVALSAGSALDRIMRIQMECQDLPLRHEGLLYPGQRTKVEVEIALLEHGFHLERCWETNPSISEENCIFARDSQLLNVRQDCFNAPIGRLLPTIMNLLQFDSNISWDALHHTPRIAQYNMAKMFELLCCSAPDSQSPKECFNGGRSYERCCLRAYFAAIDYIRDWSALRLESVWMPGANVVHLVWNTDSHV